MGLHHCSMSEDEQDRVVGAAYRRLKTQERQVACLRGKLAEMGRAFVQVGSAAEHGKIRPYHKRVEVATGSEGPVKAVPEWNPVDIPDRDDFLQTLTELHDAKAELENARRSWETIAP